MFNYLPLKPENRELRLVRLQLPEIEQDVDNDSDVTKITLDLQHVSMNDETSYAAVSYVWGSATPSETIEIQVNGEPFPIGINLYTALTEFRRNRVDRWLWIDAICIHQSDQKEKSWHVDRMRDVFRDAELVYIWLGPSTVGSDVAMEFTARVGPRALDSGALGLRKGEILSYHAVREVEEYLKARSQAELEPVDPNQYTNSTVGLGNFIYDFMHEPGWTRAGERVETCGADHLITGMQDLLRRDYWHRVWVIQEVTLARQAHVYCGGKTVTLDELDAVCSTLFFCVQNEPDELFPECQNLRRPFPGSLFPSKAMEIRQLYRLQDPRPPIRLVDILLNHFSAPRRHIYTASDPRDFVFGLLGVLSEQERLGMHADYNRTAGHVLAEFTKAVFGSPTYRCVRDVNLDHSFPKQNDGITNYPSWVPDWESIGKYGIMPFPFSNHAEGGAAGELRQPLGMNDGTPEDALILRRRGCRVAVITEVMKPPEWTKPTEWPWDWRLKRLDKWLQSIRKFAGLGSESGPAEDYIWRTLARKYEGKGHSGDGVNEWKEEQNHLVRKIMRREPIDIATLTKDELDFFWKGPFAYYLDGWGVDKLEDRVKSLIHSWPKETLPLIGRTLFKTNKGMFGIGHESVKPGDIVTLIWEVNSPIVLREREDGGFTVWGDAHVDGIMNGEFLETNPVHEEFLLY